MIKKRFLLLILIVLIGLLFTACGKYNYGLVKTPEGEPVENAVVTVDGNEYETNEEGYFVLKDLKEGEYTLTINKEGYQQEQMELKFDDKSREIGEIIIKPQ